MDGHELFVLKLILYKPKRYLVQEVTVHYMKVLKPLNNYLQQNKKLMKEMDGHDRRKAERNNLVCSLIYIAYLDYVHHTTHQVSIGKKWVTTFTCAHICGSTMQNTILRY